MQNNDEVIENKRFTKEYIIGLIISFVVTLLLSAFLIFLQIQVTGRVYEENKLLIWSDALVVSGLLMVLIYLLTWLAAKGAFDIIVYSIQTVWYYTWHKEPKKKGKLAGSYAEFKAMKQAKPKAHISFLLLGASPYLLVGIVILILYYVLER